MVDEPEQHGTFIWLPCQSSEDVLIVKEEYLSSATELFAHTGVNITVDGKRHLGAALGSQSLVESYVQCKVSQWTDTVRQLSDIARTQPHAAYSTFTCGLASQWSYLSRTIPGISDMLIPIDNAINTHFIPTLTGRDSISDLERQLLVLPSRLGGLSITIPSEESFVEYSSSVKVCAPLVALIVQQIPTYCASTVFDQQQEKQKVRQLRRLKQIDAAQQLEQELPRHLKRAKELGSEKAASSWLTALPIEELGFTLHKGELGSEKGASSWLTALPIEELGFALHKGELGSEKGASSWLTALPIEELGFTLHKGDLSEKGASSWLTALPIEELGFTLHKGDFRDALCLRRRVLPPG